MLTDGVPPEFRGGVSFIYFKPPYAIGSVSSLSGHHALRTDGVHCREFAGTGPVNLKVVPNGYRLGRSPHGPIKICASLSHTHYWYEVGMLKVPALYPVEPLDLFV